MSWSFQLAIERFGWWRESCPCHPLPLRTGPETSASRGLRRRAMFSRRLGGMASMWETCPVMGKRAAEMASGDGLRALSEAMDECRGEM
eukprot:2578927-Lingulodinium_polyedra.AAC.1